MPKVGRRLLRSACEAGKAMPFDIDGAALYDATRDALGR
jgi:hypothetical protein